ncbi:glucan endo-1,3-beta-D-glucosidase-like [Lycium ferocissimum]|uniref:glucan endo-1,3-beta-D-glucosidase-like n=1 Tax=Lycium ferocissimum TaxID=112874 RepID=UPI00281524CB|nr:glucan endo-1,3-beta-D-glucosidase-like [Lycium ferocissimum]
MAKQNLFLCFLVFLSFTRFCQGNTGRPKVWCVADDTASDDILMDFFDRVPTKYLENIAPGKPCFLPFTTRSLASYVLNLVYRKTGKCPPHLGEKTSIDPSYGNCKYP